ncbi:PAAR domain-containing protein [Massilia sp.]|uniref:PAAR domain-containing protein n=1 Tax=Massilia sp. TaxID=1882437 RepID=UPI00289C76BD|nr:PAAR domain-containing protein [Massilia sp.]
MKDQNGHGVIRLGDKTSHGGKVTSATNDFTVLGKPVAVEGDSTYCPKCKGMFPIQPNGSDRKHHGKQVAYHMDTTACGAKLISSI